MEDYTVVIKAISVAVVVFVAFLALVAIFSRPIPNEKIADLIDAEMGDDFPWEFFIQIPPWIRDSPKRLEQLNTVLKTTKASFIWHLMVDSQRSNPIGMIEVIKGDFHEAPHERPVLKLTVFDSVDGRKLRNDIKEHDFKAEWYCDLKSYWVARLSIEGRSAPFHMFGYEE